MIIVGDRIHFTKNLAPYLLSHDTNEAVFIRAIENHPNQQLSEKNLANALSLMGAQALAKGKELSLYHVVLALSKGETLTKEQLKIAIDCFTANARLSGHQCIVVEHWKHKRQHFHIIYNVINPVTGLLARFDFSRHIQYQTCAELQRLFGFAPVVHKGQGIRRWEWLRGKASGINPCQLRKDVTAIFNTSRSGAEFIAALASADYILGIGKYNSYVIIDKAGDAHGLISRIEGVRLADFEKKFPDLQKIILPPLLAVRQKLRKALPRKKIARDCRAASRLLKRNSPYVQAPARYRPAPSKILRKSSFISLPAIPRRPGRKVKHEDETQAHLALPHGKSKRYLNEASKANFPDPECERAELIAWAFRNGRYDILAQFGIFCAHDALEAQAP